MLEANPEKENCTGCTACYSVCPVQAIKMEKDGEGFLYPTVNDSCIHCGKCEKVCPIVNIKALMSSENRTLGYAFCGVTENKTIWNASASGGAFTEICKAFGDSQTIIYGAAWNGLGVRHIRVEGINAIAPLRKSKYIESDMNDCFLQVSRDLKAGKKVIFSGTPCQIAGLRQIIADGSDNLLLIDLICHGVGSPTVFMSCIDRIGEQFGRTVEEYEFRAKRGYHETDHLARVKFTDHSTVYLSGAPYMQLFLSQDCLRPSCGKNCRFRCENRQGDITIADFKGLYKVFPELYGIKKNYSTLVVNTVKGKSLIPALKKQMELRECSISAIKEYNPLFSRQTVFSEQRDEFFNSFTENAEQCMEDRTVSANLMKKNIFQAMGANMPLRFRQFVIKGVRRLKS